MSTSNIVNNNMKLLKTICFLFGAISAIRIPNVGLSQESYLELTRKYSYLHFMKNLSLSSRITIERKIRTQQIAEFRAKLSKAMQAEQGTGQASKRNSRRIKSQGRMNRFRNFHNWNKPDLNIYFKKLKNGSPNLCFDYVRTKY